MPTTLAAQLIAGLELLLTLAGLWLLWNLFARRKEGAATATPPALLPWKTTGLDIAILVWLVLSGGILLQVSAMAALRGIGLEGPGLMVMVGAFFQCGMLAGCIAFTRFTATGKSYDFPRKGFVRAGLFTFLVSLPPVFAVGLTWQALMRWLEVPIDQQEMIMLFRDTSNLPLLSLMIALASLIAPLTEELIFRAGLFRMLHGQVSRWSAILLSAALFGVIHGNLASFPQLVVLGIIWAIAYERTGNIAVPMFAHALFNLNTVILVMSGIDT